ncbi:hypothetical protein Vadar_014542 [Vaccinium darrowii]|uniref:Uncharacterized protein n=1 Tax=Vaccinium darrowii TaxID=229202 RepID=A0ACB7XHH3_9ERIC|nr:hypothetical protein Vadar_014542 [Vaccinium darrowii]
MAVIPFNRGRVKSTSKEGNSTSPNHFKVPLLFNCPPNQTNPLKLSSHLLPFHETTSPTSHHPLSFPFTKSHLPLLNTSTLLHRSIASPSIIPQPQVIRCSAFSEQQERNEIFVKCMPSVVILIHTQVHGGLLLSTGGFSTGFIVSDEGHIMTCAHCAGKERQLKDELGIVRNIFLVSKTYVKFHDRDISPVKAKLVVVVPEFDVAILKIPALREGHPSLEFATRCGVVSSPSCFPHHFSSFVGLFEELFKKTVNGLHLLEIDINCQPGISGAPIFSPTRHPKIPTGN